MAQEQESATPNCQPGLSLTRRLVSILILLSACTSTTDSAAPKGHDVTERATPDR